MGNLIIDEFTDLPVSRQRINQLRMRRDDPERYKAISARRDKLPSTRAGKHKWYLKNKEKVLARGKAWAMNHKEKMREYSRNYYKLHKKRS